MRVVPRRSKDRAKVPGSTQATEPLDEAEQPGRPDQPEQPGQPEPPKSRRRGGHRRRQAAQPPAPSPPPAPSESAEPAPSEPAPSESAPSEPSSAEPSPPPAEPSPAEVKARDPRSAQRARRAAALRRTQEQRRARAKSLQAEEDQRPRSALLAMIITMGVLIAAVAVTGALIATSRQGDPVTLAAPLHVYPVTQVVQGACPAGTQGITGDSGGGPSCYQLSSGIAIRKVADLRVQSGASPSTHDVAISLLSADKRVFADLTRSSVGRPVAFVVRDVLVTAPRVDMPITGGKIVITGRFTRPDADRLVRTLKGS